MSPTTPPAAGPSDPQDLTDVPYATQSPAQRLDLYLPHREGRAVPLVVYVHGGAFAFGDKADDRLRLESIRAHGYAVAAVNYRLSGEALFPAAVQDVKAAVRWLRANAARYGIDPDRFAAWGDSAGGHLAAMLGVTGDQRTSFDDPGLGNPGVSSAVQAVVDWYGPSDFLAMDTQARASRCPEPQVHDVPDSPESVWLGAPVQTVPTRARAANPISYAAGARVLPPFLVVHGDADCLVPHGQSQILVAALRRHEGEVTFTLLPGVGHGGPVFDADQKPLALAFLDRVLGT